MSIANNPYTYIVKVNEFVPISSQCNYNVITKIIMKGTCMFSST